MTQSPVNNHPTSNLLTRQEAAQYLGVSASTLAVWKCTQRYALKYVKIGRLVKYRQADLDAFIAANTALSEAA